MYSSNSGEMAKEIEGSGGAIVTKFLEALNKYREEEDYSFKIFDEFPY